MCITEAQGSDSALLGCGELALLPVSFFSSKFPWPSTERWLELCLQVALIP